MSEFDILFPIPDGNRNADDMGMPADKIVGSTDVLYVIVERGPWAVDCTASSNVWFVESADFTHDVRLYINGDFSSDAERRAYAEAIAMRLNEWQASYNAKLSGTPVGASD